MYIWRHVKTFCGDGTPKNVYSDVWCDAEILITVSLTFSCRRILVRQISLALTSQPTVLPAELPPVQFCAICFTLVEANQAKLIRAFFWSKLCIIWIKPPLVTMPTATVQVRHTTTTSTSRASVLVINTGYLSSKLGILKLLVLVGHRSTRKIDIN